MDVSARPRGGRGYDGLLCAGFEKTSEAHPVGTRPHSAFALRPRRSRPDRVPGPRDRAAQQRDRRLPTDRRIPRRHPRPGANRLSTASISSGLLPMATPSASGANFVNFEMFSECPYTRHGGYVGFGQPSAGRMLRPAAPTRPPSAHARWSEFGLTQEAYFIGQTLYLSDVGGALEPAVRKDRSAI